MRLSAEEARQNANLKTSGEFILTKIFKLIKSASDHGLKQLNIYHNIYEIKDFSNVLIEELFNNKDKYDYIENVLISLGFKVTRCKDDIININWE